MEAMPLDAGSSEFERRAESAAPIEEVRTSDSDVSNEVEWYAVLAVSTGLAEAFCVSVAEGTVLSSKHEGHADPAALTTVARTSRVDMSNERAWPRDDLMIGSACSSDAAEASEY